MSGLAARIRALLLSHEEAREGPSAFASDDSQLGYYVDGKQIAHAIGEDAVELRLTKAVIREHRARLKAEPAVELRRTASDWLIVRRGASDELLGELVGLAVAAHAPPPGAVSRPPPTGADLARRRRWH